jgi:hypothetical protein
MSSFKDRSDLFKLIAKRNLQLRHTVVEDDTARKSFFRINDEEELDSSLVDKVHFPLLVHVGHNVRFRRPQTGLIKRLTTNSLLILDKVSNNLDVNDADAIEAAYDKTMGIAEEIISYIKKLYADNSVCNPFGLFDISKYTITQVGAIAGNLYGYQLLFEDDAKTTALEWNANKWNMTLN